MTYTHENNPISPKHPLLELLLRVGLVFNSYSEGMKEGFGFVEYCIPEAWGDDIEVVRLVIYAKGQWTYGSYHHNNFIKPHHITTEHEMLDFLRDTELGARLFRRKLRLLHATIAD